MIVAEEDDDLAKKRGNSEVSPSQQKSIVGECPQMSTVSAKLQHEDFDNS